MKPLRRAAIVAFVLYIAVLPLLLTGCGQRADTEPESHRLVATTYPMYYLTSELCRGIPDLTVEALIQEPVSCLHNYSITTAQMKALDRAEQVIMNGAGLEEFLESALRYVPEERRIDAAAGLDLLHGEESEFDPHVWLSPELYAGQAENIAEALSRQYPEYAETIQMNGAELQTRLEDLQQELYDSLRDLSCRDLITFHDGFSYFARAFDLNIAAAVEEEEGAETPARELRALSQMVTDSGIPAIFRERNGSSAAASIISQETGVKVFILNTVMDGETDYFTAMRENAAAVREALK